MILIYILIKIKYHIYLQRTIYLRYTIERIHYSQEPRYLCAIIFFGISDTSEIVYDRILCYF